MPSLLNLTRLFFVLLCIQGCAQTVFVDPSAGSCTDPAPANTGTGTCTISNVTAFVKSETFTFTATSTGPNATFTVVGSVSGALTSRTSGSLQQVQNANGFNLFKINLSDGGTNYAINDNFQVTFTAGTALNQTNFNLLTLDQIASNGASTNEDVKLYKGSNAGDDLQAQLDIGNLNASQGKVRFYFDDTSTAGGSAVGGMQLFARNTANTTDINGAKVEMAKQSGADTTQIAFHNTLNGTFGVQAQLYFNGTVPTFLLNVGAPFSAGVGSVISQGDTTAFLRIEGQGNCSASCIDLQAGSSAQANEILFRRSGLNNQPLVMKSDGEMEVGVGASTAQASIGGTLSVNTTNVGNVGTGEDDLMTYSLPASALSTDGMKAEVHAWGYFASNGNNKTVKCYFGSTQVFSSTALAFNGAYWDVRLTVIRTGAATQKAVVVWNSDSNLLDTKVTSTTPGQTLSSAVTIKCTGEATSDNDIVQEALSVNWEGL